MTAHDHSERIRLAVCPDCGALVSSMEPKHQRADTDAPWTFMAPWCDGWSRVRVREYVAMPLDEEVSR